MNHHVPDPDLNDEMSLPLASPGNGDDEQGHPIGVPSITSRMKRVMEHEAETVAGDASASHEAIRVWPALGFLPDSDEKYLIESEIGRGGMSRVWATRDHDLGRVVAMKVLDETLDAEPDELGRFIQEGQITGQLEHPNIVPVHELGCTDEGQLYFTMKRVRGISLGEILFRIRHNDDRIIRRFDLRALLRVLVSVCDAMAYAHDRHVLHRDLKPENIMVGRFGEVLVMDWGIARIFDPTKVEIHRHDTSIHDREITDRFEAPGLVATTSSRSGRLTMHGQIAGTPAYMPPEAARGESHDVEVGPRTDIYSLGAILYEVLTLEPPYVGDNALVIVRQLLDHVPTPVRNRTPQRHVPPELAAIVEKAMAREPQGRYPSVQAFAADLEAWLDRRPVSVYRDSIFSRSWKWSRRHATAATALFSLAVLLVVITVFSLVALHEAEQAREAREIQLKAQEGMREKAEQALRAEREARALAMRKSQVESLLRNVPRDASQVADSQVDTVLGLYNRVLVLDPDHVPTLVDRAVLNERIGRRDDARRDLERALEIAPDDVAANAMRAQMAERSGDYFLALRHAERAVDRRPYEAPLHELRLRILARLKRFDEAQDRIDRLLPSLPDLVRLRVWFYEAERELADAPDHVVILRLRDDTPEGRGLAMLADRRYARAQAEFEAACDARPGSIAAWYGRACSVARSQPRMAQIFLERAWENGLRDCPWHVLWYEPELQPLHTLPDFRALADTGAQSRPARHD